MHLGTCNGIHQQHPRLAVNRSEPQGTLKAKILKSMDDQKYEGTELCWIPTGAVHGDGRMLFAGVSKYNDFCIKLGQCQTSDSQYQCSLKPILALLALRQQSVPLEPKLIYPPTNSSSSWLCTGALATPSLGVTHCLFRSTSTSVAKTSSYLQVCPCPY